MRQIPGTVILDVDGVCYPYVDAIRSLLSPICERQFPEPGTYNLCEAWGIHRSQHVSVHQQLFASSAAHARLPMPGSAETVAAWQQAGVTVRWATQRAHWASYECGVTTRFRVRKRITENWLRVWYNAKPEDIYFTNSKLKVLGRSPSNMLFIDDNPFEAELLARAGQSVILLEQPYNEESPLQRVSWADLAAMPVAHLENVA